MTLSQLLTLPSNILTQCITPVLTIRPMAVPLFKLYTLIMTNSKTGSHYSTGVHMPRSARKSEGDDS